MLYLLENTLLGAGNHIYHGQALTFFELMVVQYITSNIPPLGELIRQ